MRYSLMMISLLFLLLTNSGVAANDDPTMIIVSAEAAIKAEDVTNISLRYSKSNDIMVLKVEFSENGKKKFGKLFKSNKGKKLALIDGRTVIMEPVYLQTETVSDQIDIFIPSEEDAISLLKKLSR